MANTPRVTTGKYEDNTGRLITQDYQAPTYAASIALLQTEQNTTVKIVLTGALTLTTGTTTPLIGDQMNILFTGDTVDRIVTYSTGFSAISTQTISGNSTGAASFVYDGHSWVCISYATLGVSSVQTPAYAATLTMVATARSTKYMPALLTGALTINATDVSGLSAGDTVQMAFIADGTNRTVTFGTNFKTSGTLTVTASKWAGISFLFNGTYLVATGREISA